MINLDRLKPLQTLIQKEVASGELFGSAVTVGTADGEVYTAAAGDIGPDTPVMLCSMTKPVTSVAASILMERGVLDAMDRVADYLPGFSELNVYENGILVPAKRDLLISDLLNMTSGVTYGLAPAKPGTPEAFMRKIQENWKERILSGEKMSNLDMLNELGQVPLMFHPGDHWNYGKSADLLAGVVEAASGMTYGEFLKKEIFEPLSMDQTAFYYEREQVPYVPRILMPQTDGSVRETTMEEFYGDGLSLYEKPYMENGGGGVSPIMGRGLYASLNDYARFARMLLRGGELDGKRILSRFTVDTFAQNHLTEDQMKTLWPWMAGYGYGNLMRVMVNPALSYTNGRKGEFGWDGALGTYFFVDPEAGIYMVYMQQKPGGIIRRRLRNVAYSAIEG